jgi:hypothetical protein
MSTKNKKIIRIEPSPFKNVKLKLKMTQAKVNSAGHAIQDGQGNIVKSEVDMPNTVQIPGTSKTITPAITSSGLKTGLNVYVDNPYKEEENYLFDWAERVFKGKDKVLLQHVLEYKHRKPFNHYTNQLFDEIKPSTKIADFPFFMRTESKLILSGNVTFLNLDNPIDEVKYYMAKAHSDVANSYADLNNGRSNASYYMVDEVEMTEVEMSKIRKETKASAILEELLEEESDAIIKMAQALGNEDKNLKKSKAFIWLGTFYKKGESNYNAFISRYKRYKDPNTRELFYAEALLQDLLNYGIFRKRDNKYYWTKPGDDRNAPEPFEFPSKEKVVKDFLCAPEYQEEVEMINSLLKQKK